MPLIHLTIPSSTYRQLFYRDYGRKRGYEIIIFQEKEDRETCMLKILHCEHELESHYDIEAGEEPLESIKNILCAADKIVLNLVIAEIRCLVRNGTYVRH